MAARLRPCGPPRGVSLASLTRMADEQGAAPAAAPRVQVTPHRRFSDSIQPPGGWVNDPSEVRQTRSTALPTELNAQVQISAGERTAVQTRAGQQARPRASAQERRMQSRRGAEQQCAPRQLRKEGGGARAGTESRARYEAGNNGGSSNPGGTVIHMHGLFRVIEAVAIQYVLPIICVSVCEQRHS